MSCFHTSLSRAHPTHRARPSHRAPVQLTPWHTRPHPEHQRKASRCKAALPFHRAPVQLTPWHMRPLPGHQRKASRCKAALPPSLGGPALPATQQQPGTQSSATSNVKARAYDLCLSLGITQSTGFRLASSHPDMKVSDLAARTAQLAKQLSIPVEDLCLLASKEPAVLRTAPAQIGQTLEILRQIMGGLTPTEAGQAIIRNSGLLGVSAEVLLLQFDALEEILETDRAQLSRLVRMQPYMLTAPLRQIHRRMCELSVILNLSLPQTVQLLAAYPPLSIQKPAMLGSRLNDLCAVLGADMQQVLDMISLYPPILMNHPGITEARIQYLADNLNVKTTSLNPIVLRSPELLSQPQNVLVSHFDKLFVYFGQQGNRSSDEVLALVAENPALLGLGPETQRDWHTSTDIPAK